jgi:RimJ/RimL family protein N-acetyltransferase
MSAMSAVTTGLTFSELESADWPRLLAFEPFKSTGLPVDNGHWRIFIAELDGQIIGCVSLHSQVHWDPWWIHPEHRGNAGIVRGLIKQGVSVLNQLGITDVFATISDENTASQALAERLGFERAPGELYVLRVPSPKE